jgi:photosynthetic reaction center cytochrome c subunit
MHKLALVFLTSSVLLVAQPPAPPAQPGRGGGRGPGITNLMILPETTTFPQILPIMETFEVSLGVQCTYCHVQGNFASDDNMRKNTARAMMRIVNNFNKTFPDGNQHIGCWSCHRGATKPEITPPANLLEEAAKAVAAGQGAGRGGAAPPTPPK